MTSLITFPAMPLRPILCGPDVEPSIPLVEGHLHIALTVDDGVGLRKVTRQDLAAWNATLEDLYRVALQRLGQESDAYAWMGVDTVPGMALYQAEDGLSSSRMLILDQLVDDWPIAGVVVAVPGRDQLIAVPLTEIGDIDALNVMVTAAGMAFEDGDAPLTNQAFWTDGETWELVRVEHEQDNVRVYLPERARAAIRRLAAMGLVACAGEA